MPKQSNPTVKYFEQDAFAKTLTATLVAVDEANGKLAFDTTIFFPEGGGQPCDKGQVCFTSANGSAHALAITDVHEKEGIVWHTAQGDAAIFAALSLALENGETPSVSMEIDWAHRFDSMQQHSGEHLLSGALHLLFGAENVGFHIGETLVRMDTNIPLTAAQLRRAEEYANEQIWQDTPIVTTTPSPEELAALTYRSKKELSGVVRIVTISEGDCCACCGTHLASTGQIGQVRIISAEHYKGGERLSVVCGKRALVSAQQSRDREAEIGALLSAKSDQTATAVQRIFAEHGALKLAKQTLEKQLFASIAAALPKGKPTVQTLENLTPDGLHHFALALSNATNAPCAALAQTETGIGYCMADMRGEGALDLRPLCKTLNQTFQGRGGGKPNICQGSLNTTNLTDCTLLLEENFTHENAL